MARPLTERKNIDLEMPDRRRDPARLLQDQGKVQQILNNLLSNAIKFTPEGGRITVRAGAEGRRRSCSTVADTGVGIAEEDQRDDLREIPPGQGRPAGDDAMTREYSGTGLGLSIVKELCKLLGGEVTCESELGKGSTFTVRLPLQLPGDRRFVVDVADHPRPLQGPPRRGPRSLPHAAIGHTPRRPPLPTPPRRARRRRPGAGP